MTLSARDFDYIEARLLAPATDLSDAIARLRRAECDYEADRLLKALQKLTDVCRDVRRSLPSPVRSATECVLRSVIESETFGDGLCTLAPGRYPGLHVQATIEPEAGGDHLIVASRRNVAAWLLGKPPTMNAVVSLLRQRVLEVWILKSTEFPGISCGAFADPIPGGLASVLVSPHVGQPPHEGEPDGHRF